MIFYKDKMQRGRKKLLDTGHGYLDYEVMVSKLV